MRGWKEMATYACWVETEINLNAEYIAIDTHEIAYNVNVEDKHEAITDNVKSKTNVDDNLKRDFQILPINEDGPWPLGLFDPTVSPKRFHWGFDWQGNSLSSSYSKQIEANSN